MRARVHPDRLAIEDGDRTLTYARARSRARGRLANALVGPRRRARRSRVAMLSENRASTSRCSSPPRGSARSSRARTGGSRPPSSRTASSSSSPACVVVSPRHAEKLARARARRRAARSCSATDVRSGSTRAGARVAVARRTSIPRTRSSSSTRAARPGLPKGAVLSHRAEIVRNLVAPRRVRHRRPTDAFVAWSPLYHMGAAEWSLGTLMSGGR